MDENGLELMIVDGTDGWTWDGESFTRITDQVFEATLASSVAYLDNAFWVPKSGSGQFYGSGPLDARTWPALKFATAEYKSDNVDKIWVDRELLLMGDRTVQVYYNAKTSPMPMEPMRNGRVIYGLAAENSVAIVNNATHALFSDANGGYFVGQMVGANVVRLSTPALNDSWSRYADITDAVAYPIHFHGYEWYVISWPVADHGLGRTFMLDVATGLWGELGAWEGSVSDFKRHPMRFHLFFGGKHLIGDGEGGLWALDEDTFTMDEDKIISLMRFPVIENNRERGFHEELQLWMRPGVGTLEETTPEVILEISNDGGATWPGRKTKDLGAEGKSIQRIRFDSLGSSFDRVYQISVSDPVKREFITAFV